MQEEIERQTVALVFKAGKLTGETLADAMGRALNRGLNFHKAEKESIKEDVTFRISWKRK